MPLNVIVVDGRDDISRVVAEVNRHVKETFAEDFALDQFDLASDLVPVLADRLSGKVRMR